MNDMKQDKKMVAGAVHKHEKKLHPGKPVKAASNSRPDRSDASTVNMSVAGINRRPAPEAKTTGIVTRGNGAATKGTIARGPMA